MNFVYELFFILILLSNLNVRGYQKIYTALPLMKMAFKFGKMPTTTVCVQVSHTCYFKVGFTVRYLTI